MELLFLLAMIGLVAYGIGQGGSCRKPTPSGQDEGEGANPIHHGNDEMNGVWGAGAGFALDDSDELTDPAYSHLPGNIHYSSDEDGTGIGLSSDDDLGLSDSFSPCSSDPFDLFDSGDGIGLEDPFTDPSYFWMEGNIYHTDLDDCCSNDDFDSSDSSSFDDW